MRNYAFYLFLVVPMLVLSSCTAASNFQTAFLVHQTGSAYRDRQPIIDQCEFDSIKAVPRAMITETSGGQSSPGSVSCQTGPFGSTTCNTIGGGTSTIRSQSHDANAELRHKYMRRCLADRGFTLHQKPVCSTQAEKQMAIKTRDNQPPASDIRCVYLEPING